MEAHRNSTMVQEASITPRLEASLMTWLWCLSSGDLFVFRDRDRDLGPCIKLHEDGDRMYVLVPDGTVRWYYDLCSVEMMSSLRQALG